jgi:glycerate 2-kinase
VLLAVGKAASAMAAAAEKVLGGRLDQGLVVDIRSAVPLKRSRRLLAGHPLPDARGLRAGREVLRLCAGLESGDTLLVLLSGGASALLPAPAGSLTLAQKAATTQLLLRAGAPIAEMNAVRKHLSQLKGGGLARAAAPARVLTLVLSDVVGDDLSTIASGPTVADPTTYAQALEILSRRRLLSRVPAAVRRHLEQGRRHLLPETPKPGDPVLLRAHAEVVGSLRQSLAAAEAEARRRGFRTTLLTASLEGEAREVGRVLASILEEQAARARQPLCLLAGGETTVTVRGAGRGGRNQELAVAAIRGLAAATGNVLLATLATDGIDGPTGAAGGVADASSLRRAAARGLPGPEAFLEASDSHALLSALGDLIVTGPSGTNVADLTLMLAAPLHAKGL